VPIFFLALSKALFFGLFCGRAVDAVDPFLQAQSAAVARDRAVSEAQGLREQIAKLKAEVEGLSQPSDKTNGINSKDTDNSINNGVAFAEHCPNCGYSIAATQTEEHSEHGHHHFLSMSKVSQSEQAILSIEKRLADESQASLRNQSVCQNRLTASNFGAAAGHNRCDN